MRPWAALLALALAGCIVMPGANMPRLASAVVSRDFTSYQLRRIGLPAFRGRNLAPEHAATLQRALHSELAQTTPYEIVLLEGGDLAELESSDPYRRGWYKPKTIIGLSQRYNLDGILFGTVTQQRCYPPQSLALSVDLVSAETGLVIWSASVDLDASDQRVVSGLRLYYDVDADDEDWRVALLSPERFARFAAFQIACLL